MSAMISGRLRQRWQNLVEYRTFGRADIKDSYHWDFLWAFFRSFLCMFLLFFDWVFHLHSRNEWSKRSTQSLTGQRDWLKRAVHERSLQSENFCGWRFLKRLIGFKIQDFDSANVSWMIVWEIEQLRAVDFFNPFVWIKRKDEIVSYFFNGKISGVRKISIPFEVENAIRVAFGNFFCRIAWSGVCNNDFIKLIWNWPQTCFKRFSVVFGDDANWKR